MPDQVLTREQRDTLLHDLELTFYAKIDAEISAVDGKREFVEDAFSLYDDLKRENQAEYCLTAPPERLERIIGVLFAAAEGELRDCALEPSTAAVEEIAEFYRGDEVEIAKEVAHFRREARESADEDLDVRSACRAALDLLGAEGGR